MPPEWRHEWHHTYQYIHTLCDTCTYNDRSTTTEGGRGQAPTRSNKITIRVIKMTPPQPLLLLQRTFTKSFPKFKGQLAVSKATLHPHVDRSPPGLVLKHSILLLPLGPLQPSLLLQTTATHESMDSFTSTFLGTKLLQPPTTSN